MAVLGDLPVLLLFLVLIGLIGGWLVIATAGHHSHRALAGRALAPLAQITGLIVRWQ